jgi:two-component system, LytTR family, sensor histidine kinase AlgZ
VRSVTKPSYWICQITCWSLYGAAVGAPYILRGLVAAGPMALYSLALALLGFAQTHALRAWAKKRAWGRREYRSLIPRVVVSSAVMGAVMNGFMMVAGVYYFRHTTWTEARFGGQLLSWLWWYFPVFVGWQAIYFAVQFVRRARQAEIEKWQMKSEVQAAELRFLKSQLNPHFLFNALNSLRGLIVEDPDRAQTMVTHLSTLLRHSLRSADGTVPLERELEVVNDYLALESIRLEDRLRVTFDIDPASLTMPVPPMLVQGLVENGIKHGIALLPRGGELSIASRLTDAELELSVTNTTAEKSAPSANGIGLVNARERLRLLFGDGALLRLDASPPGHMTARLLIPRAG